jgi:oxygen-independent coproporphyrinogen III oxidase
LRRELFGIYVHLPFCDIKCAYCDFYSIAKKNIEESFWSDYLQVLLIDLKRKASELDQGSRLGSIFFGGGTPSKAPGWFFKEICNAILDLFSGKIYRKIEISTEANPESISIEFCESIIEAGVNRISVGIQSTNPETLSRLGRIYSSESYKLCLSYVKDSGLKNLNVDLISGVPGQKLNELLDDIDWAYNQGATHFSVYSLTLEPGTVLFEQVKRGVVKSSSERRQTQHYKSIVSYLQKSNFSHYEVSNFALSENYCLHNTLTWKFRPYIGIGVSAHSFLNGNRIAEPRSLNNYMLRKMPVVEPGNALIDWSIGSSRLLSDQSLNQIKRHISRESLSTLQQRLDELIKVGFVSKNKKLFSFTLQGILYADTILQYLSGNTDKVIMESVNELSFGDI